MNFKRRSNVSAAGNGCSCRSGLKTSKRPIQKSVSWPFPFRQRLCESLSQIRQPASIRLRTLRQTRLILGCSSAHMPE